LANCEAKESAEVNSLAEHWLLPHRALHKNGELHSNASLTLRVGSRVNSTKMVNTIDVQAVSDHCAECGNDGGVSLKTCKACMSVKYCNPSSEQRVQINRRSSYLDDDYFFCRRRHSFQHYVCTRRCSCCRCSSSSTI
jgi:hypothetical protein